MESRFSDLREDLRLTPELSPQVLSGANADMCSEAFVTGLWKDELFLPSSAPAPATYPASPPRIPSARERVGVPGGPAAMLVTLLREAKMTGANKQLLQRALVFPLALGCYGVGPLQVPGNGNGGDTPTKRDAFVVWTEVLVKNKDTIRDPVEPDPSNLGWFNIAYPVCTCWGLEGCGHHRCTGVCCHNQEELESTATTLDALSFAAVLKRLPARYRKLKNNREQLCCTPREGSACGQHKDPPRPPRSEEQKKNTKTRRTNRARSEGGGARLPSKMQRVGQVGIESGSEFGTDISSEGHVLAPQGTPIALFTGARGEGPSLRPAIVGGDTESIMTAGSKPWNDSLTYTYQLQEQRLVRMRQSVEDSYAAKKKAEEAADVQTAKALENKLVADEAYREIARELAASRANAASLGAQLSAQREGDAAVRDRPTLQLEELASTSGKVFTGRAPRRLMDVIQTVFGVLSPPPRLTKTEAYVTSRKLFRDRLDLFPQIILELRDFAAVLTGTAALGIPAGHTLVVLGVKLGEEQKNVSASLVQYGAGCRHLRTHIDGLPGVLPTWTGLVTMRSGAESLDVHAGCDNTSPCMLRLDSCSCKGVVSVHTARSEFVLIKPDTPHVVPETVTGREVMTFTLQMQPTQGATSGGRVLRSARESNAVSSGN
jgi:hypothetical protein